MSSIERERAMLIIDYKLIKSQHCEGYICRQDII
jgi:hypothetical protein